MYEEQIIIGIDPAELVDKVSGLKEEGYRLVQICCTKFNGFELLYTFEKDNKPLNLKLNISQETEIMSVSGIFFPAFLYENEMKDLFGVKIKHIALDFEGNFYKVSEKTPFNPQNNN